MKFFTAALVFAGAVMAHGHESEAESTVLSTEWITITSCGPTVTNCPADSTKTTSTVYAVSTTPTVSIPESTIKYSNSSAPATSTIALPTSVAAVCPTYSVKTISTSVTTVIPTVIYETVSVPCPTTTKASVGFTSTANSTLSTSKPTSTIVTAGAASKAGSVLFAAAAGLAAVALA